MGVHKVSAFHPFIFQKSGKSTIIRNLSPLPFCCLSCVFFSSIRVDPGPTNRGPTSVLALKIRTPVANTREIKVHRSNACGEKDVFYSLYRFRCYIFVTEKKCTLKQNLVLGKNCPFMTNNKNLGKRVKNQNHKCTIHRNTTNSFTVFRVA
jgi:hypothetical protein